MTRSLARPFIAAFLFAPLMAQPSTSIQRIYWVAPLMPRFAMDNGIQGTVELAFTVATDGKVKDAEVLFAEPPNVFEAAALDAVHQWIYEPHRPYGKNTGAVEMRLMVRLRFPPAQRRVTPP